MRRCRKGVAEKVMSQAGTQRSQHETGAASQSRQKEVREVRGRRWRRRNGSRRGAQVCRERGRVARQVQRP